ncbi:hypothetical protein [Raineyella antarctica]|uniref:hypothetical protein n=1 Tax=Raineyella antarctica TaxID=1577474 RepID=UPI0015880763|nr:hypothetical protein [Raineyella antarctica]
MGGKIAFPEVGAACGAGEFESPDLVAALGLIRDALCLPGLAAMRLPNPGIG